jgi:3D (Asp-Asp-Asp) domain-containing protein
MKPNNNSDHNISRWSHLLAHGFFFIAITSNLMPALTTISSTLEWAGVGGDIVEAIKLKAEESKYEKVEVIATAYSSTPDQTDSTPFITAANTHVRDGIVAANFLKMYTQIKIPSLYGDKIFTVEDRMNRRYNEVIPPRIDLWMEGRSQAIRFGIKKLEILVLK